jgi:hypothetical protein
MNEEFIEITVDELFEEFCEELILAIDQLPVVHTMISEDGADDLIFKEDVLSLLRREDDDL